ncbi:MAG: ribonucleotide-diphosphate reductase subunit alpha, partial [Alphaproteobacteria bacterium]|nr:ribonucleotide-diphosphate reductase subunit alpha [Alphaproteobacteria bacterium]
MDFRDTQETGAGDVTMTQDSEVLEAPAKAAQAATEKLAQAMASAAVEETSHTVRPQLYPIKKDESRDALLTDFGKETLKDRYLLPGESFQDLFVRVASAYADDAEHAQRIYDYIS